MIFMPLNALMLTSALNYDLLQKEIKAGTVEVELQFEIKGELFLDFIMGRFPAYCLSYTLLIFVGKV